MRGIFNKTQKGSGNTEGKGNQLRVAVALTFEALAPLALVFYVLCSARSSLWSKRGRGRGRGRGGGSGGRWRGGLEKVRV